MGKTGFTLLEAGFVCVLSACGGQAEEGGIDADRDPVAEDEGAEFPSASGGSIENGEGEHADDAPPPQAPGTSGGSGGEPLSVDLDLWCPTGQEWEQLLGSDAPGLGGATSALDCPELPEPSYTQSYCVIVFASTLPVRRVDTPSCCYPIEWIHCR